MLYVGCDGDGLHWFGVGHVLYIRIIVIYIYIYIYTDYYCDCYPSYFYLLYIYIISYYYIFIIYILCIYIHIIDSLYVYDAPTKLIL